MNKLEVIAWSMDDAIKIEQAGADRIELVIDLEKGGLTPPLELVKQVIDTVKIPVRVMVRDTDASFVYDKETMDKHLMFITALKDIKPEGIVFGSLTKDNKIDFKQLKQVIDVKGDMRLTFHRAFDELDSSIALKQFDELSKYDVDTLLTSGLEASALKGSEFIKKLIDKRTINILPGKSIDFSNYKDILKETHAKYLHVGYSVRDKQGNIDIELIEELKKGMNND